METYHSVGQKDGQMGDNLPTIDLGTSAAAAAATASSTSASSGVRKLRGVDVHGDGDELTNSRSLQSTSDVHLAAGGHRSCAILESGDVKVWCVAV